MVMGDSEVGDFCDMVVVGGGITGAAIARDAALRGLRVMLLEKGDFASGTSSKSSKLIHGGLRYLEHAQVGLVYESVSERAVQSRLAPHLVKPLSFLVPVYRGAKPGLELMNIGLWLYDCLALFRAPKFHKTVRGAKAAKLEPRLRCEGLRGAIEYYDCVTDDARLVLENVLDARDAGAVCRSHTEVVELIRGDGDRVDGVRARDLVSGEECTVHARMVVLATGAWTDEASHRWRLEPGRKFLRLTKGVHAVFPADILPLTRAVTMRSPLDGRPMFAVPWRGRIFLGTTDTDFSGSADRVYADADDIAYLCDSANHYFPEAGFSPQRVIATWAGLRPLIREEGVSSASAVSREHEIFVRDDGVILIAGGKLTTYRLMAKQVLDRALVWLKTHESAAMAEHAAISPCMTKDRPLPGARGLSQATWQGVKNLAAELMRAAIGGMGASADADSAADTRPDTGGGVRAFIDSKVAHHLAEMYGSRAHDVLAMAQAPGGDDRWERMQGDLPFIWAEVHFAVVSDMARTVDDVLSRRVPLLLLGRDQGLDVVLRVAEVMAGYLGWDDSEVRRQVAHYQRVVADTRRFHQQGGKAQAASQLGVA